MLTTSEVALLQSACQDFAVQIPAAVPEAEQLASAAEVLVAKIKAEVEPDPHAATVKSLEKLHAELVAWPQHEARLTVANKLLDLAQQRVLNSWEWAATGLSEKFKPVFAKVAEAYYLGHTDHSDDPDAVANLERLARTRDILASVSRAKMQYSGLEALTRCLTIPNTDVGRRVIPVRVSREVGGPPAPVPWSADWLRIVTAIEGVRLCWNTVPEQEILDAQIVKLKDALA